MKKHFVAALSLLITLNAAYAADDSRTRLKSTASSAAAGVSAANQAVTPEILELADEVYTGQIACELKAFVNIQPDAKKPGYFNMTGKNSAGKTFKYQMLPVESRSGAIRLEDAKAGAIWLQVSTKSMLINQKIGQRLADECMHSEQIANAKAMRENPSSPSLMNATGK